MQAVLLPAGRAGARRQAATQPAAGHAGVAAEPVGGLGEPAEETLTVTHESTETEETE